MKKWHKYLLLSLIATALLLGSAWLWLNRTESGLDWLLSFATSEQQPQISITGTSGTLANGFKIKKIYYADAGTEVKLSQLSAKLEYSLLPFAVKINNLNIGLLDISQSDADTGVAETIDDLSLPLELEITKLNIAELIYRDQQIWIQADNLKLSLAAGQQLQLHNLETNLSYLSADETALITGVAELSGELSLSAPWQHEIELGMSVNSIAATDNPYLAKLLSTQFELKADGNFNHTATTLNATGSVDFNLQAQLRNLADKPQWQAQLSSEALSLPLSANNSMQLNDLNLASEGELEQWQLSGQAELEISGPQIEAVTAQWDLLASTENTQALKVERFSLTGELGQLDFNGKLQTADRSGSGRINLERFKAGYFIAGWPLTATTSASTQVDFSTSTLRLDKLVAVIDDSNAAINGEIEINAQVVTANLGWQNLEWPIASGVLAEYRSPQGILTASGTPDAYSVNAELDLQGQQIPAGNYMLKGHGNRDSLTLDSVNSLLLEGSANLTGKVQWQPEMQASMDLNAKALNLGSFWKDYPSKLDLALQLEWQTDTQLQIQLTQLSGQFREQAVVASGGVNYADGVWSFNQVSAQSGESKLKLDGQGAIENLLKAEGKFNLEIPDLSQWVTDLSGSIHTKGEFQQTESGQNKLIVSATGKGLKATGLSLAEFNFEGEAAFPETNGVMLISGDLQGTQLEVKGFEEQIDTVSIKIMPLATRPDGQALNLTAKSTNYSLNSDIDFQIFIDSAQPRVAGQVKSLTTDSPVTGPMALQVPTSFEFTGSNFKLSPACFRQQPDKLMAEVCLSRQAAEARAQNIETTMLLENFPLAWVTAYFPVDLAIGQSLSGKVIWLEAITNNREANYMNGTGSVDLIVNPGIIASVDIEAGYLETGEGWLKMQLDPKKLFSASAWLPMSGDDALDIKFNLHNLGNPKTATVESKINLQVADLSSLKWLVPGLDQLSGAVDINMQLLGDIVEPKLSGSAKLNNVNLFYTPLGLELTQLNLDGSLVPGQTSGLSGSFLAGGGKGGIELKLDSSQDQPKLSLSLSGNDLQFINQPNLAVTVSPDIELLLTSGELQVAGEIIIPAARIKPLPGSLDSASISKDVIVSGLPEIAPVEHTTAIPIVGQLKLHLGDDVVFKADGVEAELEGELNLNFNKNNSIPQATGEIRIADGYFKQYGQNLNFEDSIIRFDGKSVLEPLVDVSAVRHIFGDAQVETAGVRATGRPSNLQLKLFTDPPTNEETAAAYVATGSSFDHGSGVGALNIGTYLYPKLFVSYGLGLFDSGNIISVRYELTEHWAVQGTSGEEGSGVDLMFSVDR